VELKGQRLGRMKFVLFSDVSPRAAENFRCDSMSQAADGPNMRWCTVGWKAKDCIVCMMHGI
jgi:hypothetical protein